MAIRLFSDGRVLRPVRMVVMPIMHASISLANVMLVVLSMSLVLMLVYGQLFGVFDDALSLGTWGLARLFKMLYAPGERHPPTATDPPRGAAPMPREHGVAGQNVRPHVRPPLIHAARRAAQATWRTGT